ncbi:hypothetical protein PPYR_06979 [Photinus pyralis]|uniref:Cytochrome P450 n=1 Tax=Photinus pyralis TaxID=7054 RepID=A0A5N4AP47_PHOPY|nr:cytochrome P450 4g15-like [Photinus pyralis]XP_031339899.1 cytochrome P450 4g15-like [Photinus pyralis]KAB0799099.1 hypothetical protein PPYR_06979 [Photinus pyralis]
MTLGMGMAATTYFIFLLVPVLILWYIYWRIKHQHMIDLAEQFPGPKGYPLIGNALLTVGSPHEMFKTALYLASEYHNIGRAWLGPRLVIGLADPRDVEIILSSHEHIEKAVEYKFFKPWFGNGLLISSGTTWKAHRKLIAPTFHLNILKGFIDLFNANSREVVKKLRQENGKTFDCHDHLSEATVEILLETVMGVSKKTQGKSGYDYAMAVMKMCAILHIRQVKIWLRPDWIFKFTTYQETQKKLLAMIHSLTEKVFEKKRKAFEDGIRGSLANVPEDILRKDVSVPDENIIENPLDGTMMFGQSVGIKDDLDGDVNVGDKKRYPFLETLIEAAKSGTQLTEEEVKNQVSTIMFEGHDTTAAASSFFLCLMGAHPDVQEKVHQEMYAIFGNSDRPVTYSDTLEMKYLERCLLETLRLYPPVPLIARKINQDVKLASGNYTVPAGCTVIIGTYVLHRNPDIYTNPDEFNPDNFLPERCIKRPYYAFIPFSAGPRGCVGRKYAILKLKVLLATIMRNFVVKSDASESEYKLQADIILKRQEGFKIRLEPKHLIS